MEWTPALELAELASVVERSAQRYRDTHTPSLESYLRSLRNVCDLEIALPTWGQIGGFIEAAFTAPPPPTDSERDVAGPPNLDSGEDSRLLLAATLNFQISELQQMGRAGLLENPLREYGIESPSGQTWYNFDPIGYLGCGLAGLSDCADPTILQNAGWLGFAEFLEFGRTYE